MKYSNNEQLKEQIKGLPLHRLQNIDIRSAEEEKIVQAEVNKRVTKVLPTHKVYRGDIPDISSPAEEAKWQQTINERAAALMPKLEMEPEVAEPEVDDSDFKEVFPTEPASENPPVAVAKKGGRPKKILTE